MTPPNRAMRRRQEREGKKQRTQRTKRTTSYLEAAQWNHRVHGLPLPGDEAEARQMAKDGLLREFGIDGPIKRISRVRSARADVLNGWESTAPTEERREIIRQLKAEERPYRVDMVDGRRVYITEADWLRLGPLSKS